ncbi:PSD1 and planctomycete cytochrome C domain-containing protein [Botrimarina hoheduenensis]|uniref:PSD1 and planctomycete cytochrome C domain-containing protein n=1 Tax=Botrimarina hoheduenensis TaxID=2528000 RepID=UPI0018D33781|nr:PSD1 and planctomycete cytochrome C domain-containing protein [Botrimarina hoheduenensis]
MTRSLTPLVTLESLGVLAMVGLCVSIAPVSAQDRTPSFAHEVRPILSDRCFGCHGPADQESELRLDTFEGATDWAIVPGDADGSEVITRALLPDDDELRMPPVHSGKDRLTTTEIDILRRWITAGAEYEEHWAFTPITRSELPAEENGPTMIDRFVAERLADEQLGFLPEANRATLLRRVAFDLTGLPPSPEMAQAFLADESADAYETLVDRLLASPRYGEHMARFWLDAVRYADTHGKHFDNYRAIWPYRDWIIRSFNANKPYDEFLVEQLAGDLLPDAGAEELVASGYNRCNLTTAEGGVIEKEIYTDNVRDRTDTFGTVVLGLTVACAKCHDHKYDPITQKDYYSLFAFFNSLDGGPNDGNQADHAPAMRVPQPNQSKKLASLQGERADLRRRLLRSDAAMNAAQARWEATLAGLGDADLADITLNTPRVLATDWLWAGPFPSVISDVNNAHTPAETSAFDRDQKFALRDGRTVSWRPRPDWIDGRTHYVLPGGVGSNILRRTVTVTEPTEIEIALGSDDSVRVYLNRQEVHKRHESRAVQPGEDRLTLSLKAGENELLIGIGNHGGPAGFHFEFLRGAVTLPAEAIELASIPAESRTDEQEQLLRELFRWRSQAFPELVELRSQIAASEIQAAQIDRDTPVTLIYRERSEPREAFVLNRGEYDSPGERVDRATPGFLPPMDERLPLDRLGLAKWAVSPENPLTARVAVNRFWLQVFGVGLVKTADDFGSQADPPSHPELLDWLGAEFVESGWNVKGMMRRLVMTRAYRQQSAATADRWDQDPENRLLARGPRFRLDAEALRDQALAVSGLLVNRLGGPPVRPPQPVGLWEAVAYTGSNTARFVADTEREKIHRRSIYTFHKRTAPPPQLLVFDGPTRESCTVRRERTNTPLQALLLMNDPQFFEAARALAEELLDRYLDDTDRAAWLVERCTGRSATDEEVAEIAAAVADEKARYAQAPGAAEALLSVGDVERTPHDNTVEAAAWTLMANLALNLDEVVTKN